MNRTRLLARASAVTLALSLAASAAAAADAASSGTTVGGVTVNGAEAVTTAPVAPPIDTPYTVTTITNDEIRHLSGGATVNLQTLLINQPSVFAYSNGPLGTGTSIFYRAFNSGQFAETYDGVALNDVFNGAVTGEADTVNNVLFVPSNVDSVQLFHGINNPAVNSYNSLGGTINYLPRLPSATPGGQIGGGYGSFDTFDVHAAIDTGDIMGTRQLLTFSHAESDGWQRNTPDRNTNVFYSGSYDAANGDHVGLILVYNRNDGHTPFQMPEPLLEANGGFYQYPSDVAYEKDKDTRYLAILDFKAQLTSKIVFDNKLFGGYNDYQRTSYANPADDESATQPYELYNQSTGYPYWLDYPAGPSYDPAAVFGSTHAGTDYHFYGYTAWGLGYQPSLTIDLPHNTVIIGGNITYGDLHSREYWYGSYNMPMTIGYNNAWDERDNRLFASGYVQDEIKLLSDALTITPGIKYIYAHTVDNDAIGFYYPYGGSVGDHEDYFAPTIGANYQVSPHLSFNAAFGQNIKFPDISAYYDDIPGNTADEGAPPYMPPKVTIKPEKVNDYELGAKFQTARFAAELNLYREDFSDIFIDQFDPVAYLTHVINGGTARYQGVELRLTNDFPLGDYGDLRAFFNYSHNEAKYTSSFNADSTGGTLSEADGAVVAGENIGDVPHDLVSGGAVWEYAGWRLNAQGRYIGGQDLLDYNTGVPDSDHPTIPGYFVVDVGLSKTIELKGMGVYAKSVTFAINADNLFNKYYINYADTSIKEDYFYNETVFASPGAPRSIFGKIEVNF